MNNFSSSKNISFLKQRDLVREWVLKASLVALPLYFFNPLSNRLYIAPLEYIVILVFIIFLLSITYHPKFYFYCHKSIGLFFISGFITTLSLLALLLKDFNFGAIKAWGGRWIFRYVLIFVVVAALSIQQKYINILIKTIVYTNIIVLILGIILIVFSKDLFIFRKGIYSIPAYFQEFTQSTIFIDPNIFARFIAATFPFAFVWLRLRNSKFLIPLIVINAINIVSTVAVMGTITFILELFILLLFLKKISRKSFLVWLALLIVIPFIYVGMWWRLELKLSSLEKYDTAVRVVMINQAIRAIMDKPILGHGPGSGKYVINEDSEITYVSERIFGESHELTVHNTILAIATEAGIPAAVFFLGGILWLMIDSWKKVKKTKSSVLLSIYLAGFLSALTFFLSGMMFSNFNENIGWYGVAITLFILKAPKDMLQDYHK